MLIYMIDYCLSLWVWKNSQLCDIRYLRFHIEYRTRICSYPILNFYGPRTISIRNLDSRNILDFSNHRLQILQFCVIRLCIFHLLEGERAGNFRYAALTISTEQKNLDKTRINRDSQYCGSKLDKDYNTMSLTYVYLFEFYG